MLDFHFFNFGGDNWLTGYLFLQELLGQGNSTSVAWWEFTASTMAWTEHWRLGWGNGGSGGAMGARARRWELGRGDGSSGGAMGAWVA